MLLHYYPARLDRSLGPQGWTSSSLYLVALNICNGKSSWLAFHGIPVSKAWILKSNRTVNMHCVTWSLAPLEQFPAYSF